LIWIVIGNVAGTAAACIYSATTTAMRPTAASPWLSNIKEPSATAATASS
jgi:hypothetical protein